MKEYIIKIKVKVNTDKELANFTARLGDYLKNIFWKCDKCGLNKRNSATIEKIDKL